MSLRACGALRQGPRALGAARCALDAVSAATGTPVATHTYLEVSRPKPGVALVRLHRPKALNALCDGLISELGTTMRTLDADAEVGCMVLTGSAKAFAAGADIKEMSTREFPGTYWDDMLGSWGTVLRVRKPVIAAVNGFALGGGCELAMMCDMIFCGDTAQFGQPEIKLGTIPGGGGTQRLTRLVGQSTAMDLVLTGRMMGADEALRCGLAARVYPSVELEAKAIEAAETISKYSHPVTAMAKEAVLAAGNLALDHGVQFERRLFHATFGIADRREGIKAFLEKRSPQFRHS